jgi:hypothetical protein
MLVLCYTGRLLVDQECRHDPMNACESELRQIR